MLYLPFIAPVLVFLLCNAAAKCFAKREKCMSRPVFNNSVFSDHSKYDYRWYYPSFELDIVPSYKGSAELKKKENTMLWQELASKNLPRWIFAIVNKFRPCYDPFSDFVHYMRFKEEVFNMLASIVGAAGLCFLNGVWTQVLYITLSVLAIFAGHVLTFNQHLKRLTKTVK